MSRATIPLSKSAGLYLCVLIRQLPLPVAYWQYTLVSRTRNIVKDKGYIVAADFS